MTKKKVKPMEKRTTEARPLPYKFTEDEISNMGMELAQATASLREKEEEKKSVAAQYESDVKALKSQTSILSRKITQGEEMRQTTVEKIIDFTGDKVLFVRKDTGEIVEQRHIEDWERQIEAGLEG